MNAGWTMTSGTWSPAVRAAGGRRRGAHTHRQRARRTSCCPLDEVNSTDSPLPSATSSLEQKCSRKTILEQEAKLGLIGRHPQGVQVYPKAAMLQGGRVLNIESLTDLQDLHTQDSVSAGDSVSI